MCFRMRYLVKEFGRVHRESIQTEEYVAEMTKDEFKTILEMVRMIIDGSKDKEEALKKIDSLTILKDSDKEKRE